MAYEPEDAGLTETADTSDVANVVAFVPPASSSTETSAELPEGHSADVISLRPTPDEAAKKVQAATT
ncbi:hypothetical protein [Pyruvatibacter sp.]|uniref:hypothetical protein n=1 Tax=Pyruvatibacter sp. TaxID=1981328 RepID=UPI00326575D1